MKYFPGYSTHQCRDSSTSSRAWSRRAQETSEAGTSCDQCGSSYITVSVCFLIVLDCGSQSSHTNLRSLYQRPSLTPGTSGAACSINHTLILMWNFSLSSVKSRGFLPQHSCMYCTCLWELLQWFCSALTWTNLFLSFPFSLHALALGGKITS